MRLHFWDLQILATSLTLPFCIHLSIISKNVQFNTVMAEDFDNIISVGVWMWPRTEPSGTLLLTRKDDM